jgi:hypothetical protein
MKHKHEALWLLKDYKLCILSTGFIQSSSFNCWIKINFEFKNVIMQILKFFICVYDNQRMPSTF